MNRIEWAVASVLIMLGLHCLAFACIIFPGAGEGSAYLSFFLQICFWMSLPFFTGFIIYLIVHGIKRQKKKIW